MCVGRKPHSIGNKMHTICCCLTSIPWSAKIVEAKYLPQLLGQKQYAGLGAMLSLILRDLKTISVTSKDVFLDSLFCVEKGITDL